MVLVSFLLSRETFRSLKVGDMISLCLGKHVKLLGFSSQSRFAINAGDIKVHKYVRRLMTNPCSFAFIVRYDDNPIRSERSSAGVDVVVIKPHRA